MKCVRCIQFGGGLGSAFPAVTIHDGEALCERHIHVALRVDEKTAQTGEVVHEPESLLEMIRGMALSGMGLPRTEPDGPYSAVVRLVVALTDAEKERDVLKASIERVRTEASAWSDSPEGAYAPTRGAGHLFLGLLDVEES